ncbi:HlyC/CorC family transporter [Anaerobacillus sp. CMMVII]|uniref:hemolysin family protein n=1 Tax=Anaerobacillus sp. CMMVII TaxID=2755588 RepID=UPI0021B77B22|nr:hemolysin family protein [Anaerobacillus sp. CMMVII]MCT8139403.1 HlyC/CorC family transporter [Anaerobacillus sp. CMMVII]
MDSIPYDSIFLLGALLILSGYFSASETAITSANKVRLRNYAESNNVRATRSLKMTENFDQSLSTILIGNNIVNIAMATIATKVATDMYGNNGSTLFITTLVITILVLIFGEILPKSLAKQFAEKYLLTISASLGIVMKIFYPITWLFVKLRVGVAKMIGSNNEEPTVTDEDVKAMVEIGEEEGTFLTQEKELLHNAIEFDDIVVKDILTPRPDVIAVAVDSTIEEIKDIFIQEKYSRMPVYEGTIDNIIGIISHRDFFEQYVNHQTFDLSVILRKPYFVISSVKISNLLRELQKSKVHLAIVLDEYGGTSGIISIEDIIEEIVGEIWDENDENEVFVETISENKIRLNGRTPIETFCEALNITDIETTSNTLGGWVSETIGYLPKKGETMVFGNLQIYIEDVRNRRIQKVIVEITEPKFKQENFQRLRGQCENKRRGKLGVTQSFPLFLLL